MPKIIDFIKQKYKVLIPIMVVFVLLIAVYFLYREYRYDNYRDKQEVKVYQYFGKSKKEYTAIVTYNLKKAIIDLEGKDKKINYSSIPVYYVNGETVLFPAEMTIVLPFEGGISRRLYKYSTYGVVDDFHRITSGKSSSEYRHFFMYDGKELYFFSDESTIFIDGDEYLSLSENSYVKYTGGYTLTYYDKDKDEADVIDVTGKEITIKTNDVDIDLNDRSFNIYNKKVLLNKPSDLNPLLN